MPPTESISDTQPIGLFDSGVGGLSVWQTVLAHLPAAPTVYVADSAYCPYGSRPAAEVRARAHAITRFLVEVQRCRVIVVACNTASAAALTSLRQRFEVPFVGLEPAIKPAATASRTGHIGVLATQGTLHGGLFQRTWQRYAHQVTVHVREGIGLVEQIEAGDLDSPRTEALFRQYLEPMLAAGVDQIVLGCTHYPLARPLIERIVDGQATVVDSAHGVARQVARLLGVESMPGQAPHTLYTNGSTEMLRQLAAMVTTVPFSTRHLASTPQMSEQAKVPGTLKVPGT